MMTIGEVAAKSGVPAKTIRYYKQSGFIGRAVECRTWTVLTATTA
jgi:MerR family regulatory protein